MASEIVSMLITRFAKHLKRGLKDLHELPLMLNIGFFVLTVPSELSKVDLMEFLHALRRAQRAHGHSVAGFEEVVRLRQFWLNLPVLRWRDTCYVRALTLYRFLDCERGDLKIHFGVEPDVGPRGRLKGHAWVTLNGHVLEERAVLERPVREIYVHPPSR